MRPGPSTLLPLLCAACAVPVEPSPRDPALELPDTWQAADTDDSTLREDWWKDFGDPSLDAHVARALAYNRDLAAASARLATAVAEAGAAGAELGPTLDARFGARREKINFLGFPIPGGGSASSTFTSYDLGLDLAWEVDLWGRIRAGEMRAQRAVEAAAADFRGARLSITARTAQAWFLVVELRAQLALAEESARSFRESAERIRARFERGVRPSLDLRLALSEAAAAEATVAERRESLERATRALQVLIGRYPDGEIGASETLPRLPEAVPAGLPVELLGRRPDLVAAERRLAAADYSVAEMRANRWPRLALTASGGARSLDIGDLFETDFSVWSLAANLVAPIFDSGRRRAQIDIADARRHEALAGWAGAVLNALAEVEAALAAAEHVASQLEHVEAAAREAAAARTISEDRYARGLLDIVTLLTAQRRDVAARTNLIALRRAELDLRVELMLALGGGFDVPLDVELEHTENP